MAAKQNGGGQAGSGGAEQRLLPLCQCRKAFVLRDYSQGMAVKFFSKLPVELQDVLDENYFVRFVGELNRLYGEAEKTGLESVCETLAGCLTCYLANICMRSQWEKKLRQVALYLRQENERTFLPAGLFVTDPIERGLRCLEISFIDQPQIVDRPPQVQPSIVPR